MSVPSWGTPPETDARLEAYGVAEYTVLGIYLLNGQRVADQVVAHSAQEAINLVYGEQAYQTDQYGQSCQYVIAGVCMVENGQIFVCDIGDRAF